MTETLAQIKSNIEKLELYSESIPFTLPLRINNFENEVSYKKFIKNTELLVRRCNEYRHWKQYIIDVLQVNTCMITNESIDQVSIEIHHHVPSLYILISTLVNKKIEENEKFCSFDIAHEAIELHFKNKIGYVALIKSMHEKFHNGYLTVPIAMVKGDYNYFLNHYSKYIDETDLDVIQERLAINESNCSWAKDDYPMQISISGGNK